MKRYPSTRSSARHLLGLALAASLALPLPALPATIALATSPLANSTTSSVSPNLMFLLDDSGSMDWDYMPDPSKNFAGGYGYNTSQCNGVYYNPGITYTPPVTSSGSSYPDSSFTAAEVDGFNTGTAVDLNTDFTGGSGSGASGYTSYSGPAFYYIYSGTQTTEALRDYYDANSVFYKECNSAIGSTTAHDGANPVNTVFNKRTLSSTETITIAISGGATITINNASSAVVSSIKVNGVTDILSGSTNSSGTESTVASRIATNINNCTVAVTGICDVNGYSATASGTVVTITGPAAGGSTLTIAYTGTLTYTTTPFPVSTAVSSITVNGVQLLLSGTTATSASASTLAASVAAGINATGYSATASGNIVTVTGPASAANFTPVITTVPASGGMTLTAGTFPETDPAKLTNFANWYSYYSNRMLMMKTGVGQAFAAITDKYRVGFMTMNNNVSPGIVDIASFTGGCAVGSGTCQKDKWYTKLYGASPGNSTPLREALSKVGRLYAAKFSSTTTYTATITVGGSGSTSVSSITVNGLELMAAATSASTTSSTVASRIAGEINALALYDATASGSVVTITGPASVVGYAPVITKDGTKTFTATVFSAQTTSPNLNGITPNDPIQYSCQQNFIILSTDGFWNGNAGYKLDGTTAVGNQDGLVPRPMFDGAQITQTTTQLRQTQTQITQSTSQIQKQTLQIQSRTSSLRSSTSQLQNVASQLQQQTSTLQFQTGALQTSTSSNSGSSWTAWSNAATCTWDNTGSSRRRCRYNTLSALANASAACTANDQSANTSSGTVWSGGKVVCQYSAWSAATNTGSCTAVAQSGSSPYTVLNAVQCTTAVVSTTNVASCTVTAPDAGGASTACQYSAWSAPSNVSSCTPVAQDTTNPHDMTATGGIAANCTYTAYTAYANASSCTPVSQDLTAPYDMSASGGTATDCQTTDSGWAGASSCTPSSSGGQTVNCQTIATGPTAVASCTPAAATSGNNYTATSCTTTTLSGPTLVSSCTASAASASNGYVTTSCSPTSSSITAVSCSPQVASSGNGWTTISCSSSGGTSDTLADVAMYYYQTDLRESSLSNCSGGASTDFPTGNPDVCTDNVFISGDDNNVKQHMTTFTLGLGARGRMVFSPDYSNQTSGDFHSVKTGATAAAGPPEICSWQASGVCNWPVPGSGNPENIDDMWHAAVNGRGTYFSATDPDSLSSGLSGALSSITARKGAAAAAATSTLNPVPGNNLAYLASYTTVKWTGNLEARSINVDTGAISSSDTWCVENTTGGSCAAPGAIVTDSSGSSIIYYCATPDADGTSCSGTWDGSNCNVPLPTSCTGTLPPMVSSASDTRTIKTPSSDGTALVDFIYANLNAADFEAAHINTLSQWAALTPTQQTAAEGTNLVNFLRGQYGYEDRPANLVGLVDNRLYRFREAVLGDVLESQPFFMAGPIFGYTDPGYSTFKTANAARPGTVYVGSNDGMLHAFAAKDDSGLSPPDAGGKERWAYVPSMIIPNMWKLADTSYDTKHTNFINGSVNVADICTSNCGDSAAAVWKTILVGGLGAGGRGYFALDVTDPISPALLWEFTVAEDANLGYSFGNPVITRLNPDNGGTWVVLVTSGHNNVSSGDGKGYLYVLNAATGNIIKTIPTGVGDTTTPSGLSRIAAWNDMPSSNQAGYTYGGDLLGNVWRFDINADASTGVNPMKFATLFSDSGGSMPQPITTIPVLGKIAGKRVVFIGTGKYLEVSDLSTTGIQSVYAMMDNDETSTFVNPRNTLVEQTLQLEAGTTNSRTGSDNTVDFSTTRGWYVDFPPDSLTDPNPDTGERVNIDMALVSGTLLVPTIVPSNTVCSPGGFGWFNYFDYETGGLVATSDRFNSGIVGFNVIYEHGTPILKIVLSSGDFMDPPDQPIPAGSATGFNATRSIWRELIPQ